MGNTQADLRDIIARNNTGYSYKELIDNPDEEMLDVQEELEQIDRTVNLLGYFITAYTNTQKSELLDRLKQSLDNHTTPEGRDLLTRSYVNNTIEFELRRLENE